MENETKSMLKTMLGIVLFLSVIAAIFFSLMYFYMIPAMEQVSEIGLKNILMEIWKGKGD